MLRFLQTLSAWIFYPLAGSFFFAYLCRRQEWLGALPLWWLHVLDLPLLLAGLLYGGTSILMSVSDAERPSFGLILGIFLPIVLILAAVFVLNFGLAPQA